LLQSLGGGSGSGLGSLLLTKLREVCGPLRRVTPVNVFAGISGQDAVDVFDFALSQGGYAHFFDVGYSLHDSQVSETVVEVRPPPFAANPSLILQAIQCIVVYTSTCGMR
jgi:hypothetical protein